MLIALVVAACLAPVASEWVEISQNHYRKPTQTNTYTKAKDEPMYRPSENDQFPQDSNKKENVRLTPHSHKAPPLLDSNIPVENTPVRHKFGDQHEGKLYLNQSITEHNWNENKYRVPEIKRIDAGLKVKVNITPEFSLDILYETVTENIPKIVTKNTVNDQERVSATIERVPNQGSIRRVQLSNTPVKSPSVKGSPAISPVRRNDFRKYGPTTDYYSDEFEIKSDSLEDPHNVVNDKTQYIQHISSTTNDPPVHLFTSTRVTPVRSYDRIMNPTKKTNSESPIPFHKYSRKNIQTENNNRSEEILTSDSFDSEKDPYIQTKHLGHAKTNKENTVRDKFNFVKNTDKTTELHNKDVDLSEATTNNDGTIRANHNKKPNALPPEDQKRNSASTRIPDEAEKNKGEGIKVNTLEAVLKFMKIVAETISKNSKRGVNGKVIYLNELKDTLLHNIQERIDSTWPDDNMGPARRRSRAASARGHVEFPSSESALMTISFLTFAVFLIKLVLQVIQTYKSKAMIMAPLVVATAGRAADKLRSTH